MKQTTFTPNWYRVAGLRPKMRAQVRWIRHTYRGQVWHLTQNLVNGQFIRINAMSYSVVAWMDGHRTVEDIWQLAQKRWTDQAPSQHELMQLLGQLHQANVLLADRSPDAEGLIQEARKTKSKRLWQYLANPMSIKLPLFNPDRLLQRHVDVLPRAAWRVLPWAWLIFMVLSLGQLALQWDGLTQNLAARVFTPESLLMLGLVFPLTKLVHEWGHGLAIKAMGGKCHEMGLMFLVLVPVPYVDASNASMLAAPWRRMTVAAAGMMSELTLAGLALLLWPHVSPGPFQAMLHLVVLVAGFTTLVFNANPLLRFDGYYILADGLEIPNLAQKSNQFWLHLLKTFVLGDKESVPPSYAPGEKPWLACYALAAILYRTAVTFGIVWFVAQHYFFVGVVLAFWVIASYLGVPIWRTWAYLQGHASLQGRRARAWVGVLLSVGVLGWAVAAVPLPSATLTEGVIWLPERSMVRSPLSCFGEKVWVQPGAQVQAGQVLMSCHDPQLETQLQQEQAKLAELQSKFDRAVARDRMQWVLAQQELRQQRRVLDHLSRRRGELTITSPHAGQFNMSSAADFPGRYLERGQLLAHVLDPALYSLITVVPQGQVDRVRKNTQGIELRPADRIMDLIFARPLREVPAATHDLPSFALTLQGGGQIGTDPQIATSAMTPGESPKPKALTPLFQFELQFAAGQVPQSVGGRVHVKFIHSPEPLFQQVYRPLRQTFLKSFSR